MFELIYNDETILIVENSFVLCLKSKLLPSFSPKKKVCWWLCNANAYATIYIATLFLVWWWYISTLLMWYFFIYLLYLMFQCKHGHSDDDFYWEQMANKKNSVFFVKQLEYGCVCVCAINKQSYSDDPNRKIRWLHNFVISILSSIRFFRRI